MCAMSRHLIFPCFVISPTYIISLSHCHTHTHTHIPLQCVSGDSPHKEAVISCLDLLLRWVTLRFFDTNTTVNLKCLEFLAATFQMLVQHDNYRMSDYEAGAFLPYLVQKVCRFVFHPELLASYPGSLYPHTQALCILIPRLFVASYPGSL